MPTDESTEIIVLPHPVRCLYWEHPERLSHRFSESFEELKTFEDSSHLTRTLYRCRECGQRYFHEWYEWVDWEEGNDRSYSTLIPVSTHEEIEALLRTDIFSLMRYFPRLQWDGALPIWNGKD